MSISRWKSSRGFSAGAAFLFAVILTGAALLIQSTSPITVTPSTQTAAVNVPTISQVAADAAAAGVNTTGTQPRPVDGYDFLVNQPGTKQESAYYWPVCPPNGSVNPASLTPIAGIATTKLTNALLWKIKSGTFRNDWGNGDTRCQWKTFGDNSRKYIPLPGWKAGVLTCNYDSGGSADFASAIDNSVSKTIKVATRLPGDASDRPVANDPEKDVCLDRGRENIGAFIPAATATTGTPDSTPVNPADCDLKTDQNDKALCKLLANQKLPESSTIYDALREHERNNEWYAEYCAGKDPGTEVDGQTCGDARKALVDNEEALKKIAADQEEKANMSCDGKSGLDLLDCQKAKDRAKEYRDEINTSLKDEAAGPGTETPRRPLCTDASDPTTECESTLKINNCEKGTFYSMTSKECQTCNDAGDNACKCPAGQVYDIDNNKCSTGDSTKPQTCSAGKPCPYGQSCVAGQCRSGPTTSDGRPYGTNNGYPTNSSFGNNGNTPASPFGGACTTGYVCQGNVLYYQSTNSYGMYGGGGQGQCMTQPMQQCQYGCQPPYGAPQAGQQPTTMQTITQALPLITSMVSMFGGGSNNTAMMNPNLSRSCATQPQNPNGTGTNGQPCTQQQPPQPDPSQCTSGTWKPTSAQQNGCISGWQCVSGNGSGGTTPTAQLSCQPKIADVGMPISFSFACGNSSGSAGTGFDTGGAVNGNAKTSAPTPPSGQNKATYTLTCINQGVTASAQCDVELGRPGIVLVTNPKSVKGGDTSLIGWITSGMQSCVVSSQDQTDFSLRNANNTSVNGAATTSPILKDSRFQLDCTTLGGDTRLATTTITVSQY